MISNEDYIKLVCKKVREKCLSESEEFYFSENNNEYRFIYKAKTDDGKEPVCVGRVVNKQCLSDAHESMIDHLASAAVLIIDAGRKKTREGKTND